MIKIMLFAIIMVSFVFLLWHDEFNGLIDDFSQKTQQQAPDIINQGKEHAEGFLNQAGEKWADQFVERLTDLGKTKIDKWLKGKKLNDFGDAVGTIYSGATPIFNEATGQIMDRYVYLLKKFPDLIEELDLGKYLK